MPITNPQRLRKPCKRCDKMFRPTGKWNRVCDKCYKKSREAYHKRNGKKIKKT